MKNREILTTMGAQGELKFSANTEIALRIRRALDDPDCHIDIAARLVQASIDMLIGQETLADILRESAEEVASLSSALRF